MIKWIVLVGLGVLAVGLVFLLMPHGSNSADAEEISLAELEAEVIPPVGKETAYGIPLSWNNAQTFADWYYEVRLSPEESALLQRALKEIPTPCCDDTRITRCCCERSGYICNLVRSARGLAAWLIREKGFGEGEVREAVLEWVRFAHRKYFLALALKDRGVNPTKYGLTTKGACYRQLCERPMREGGCGGMGERVEI